MNTAAAALNVKCELSGEFARGYVYVEFVIAGDTAVVTPRVAYEDEADEGKPVDGFTRGAGPRKMTRAAARAFYASLKAAGYK